ncbi:MAG: hypothetical protein JW720_02995 [Sedimentisphaerales bacterium]|nr:hypothetical protein [Sedimentisphaerales bacterium]
MEIVEGLFRNKLNEEFPSGSIHVRESPDFVIELPTRRLGIEIIEMVRSKTVASQAGFRDKLVADAKRLCEEWSVKPLWVTVWIIGSFGQVEGRVAQKQFAERLAEVVRDGYEKLKTSHDSCHQLDDPLPGVRRIQIHLLPKGEHRWEWNPGAVWVSSLSVEDIQTRVTKKNARYEQYRRDCDECWLVMVGDSCDYQKGSDISLNPLAITHPYDSRFERIFYLQLYDELIELRTL